MRWLLFHFGRGGISLVFTLRLEMRLMFNWLELVDIPRRLRAAAREFLSLRKPTLLLESSASTFSTLRLMWPFEIDASSSDGLSKIAMGKMELGNGAASMA